jgi:hypothetical protein
VRTEAVSLADTYCYVNGDSYANCLIYAYCYTNGDNYGNCLIYSYPDNYT